MVVKSLRFLVLMLVASLATAFVLLAAVPHIGKLVIVVTSVVVALLVAAYDFGLFSDEFEI
ncbi:MAG: hypothetical protein C0624_14020 [Desulfuromonas sp.]|nr:MAG: hypothetical protein C0624_14020 [Desulfuromonas sp.]